MGEHEHSLPLMLSAKATGSYAEGASNVAKLLKAISDSPPRPRSVCSDCGWIFAENKARPKLRNNADELTSERRANTLDTLSCVAVFLAGVSAGDAVRSIDAA